MGNDKFEEIAKSKSDDELVDIIVCRDEYKEELVKAAETELRERKKKAKSSDARQKEAAPDLTNSQKQQALSSELNERTPGIYLASIISFLLFPIWILMALAQSGAAALHDDSGIGFLAMLNVFVSIARLVFGIGIYNMKPWGYNWGLGTSVINFVFLGIQAISGDSMFLGFLAVSEGIVGVSLYLNKSLFYQDGEELLEVSSVKMPDMFSSKTDISNSDIDEAAKDERLNLLSEMIKQEKNNYFGKSSKDKILRLLELQISSKSKALELLDDYSSMGSSDLIEDLKSLTSSYEGKKEYLNLFIRFEVVAPDYPHNRI